MRPRLVSLVIAVAIPFVTIPAAGQVSATAKATTNTWAPPLTPDGQPDIRGVWRVDETGGNGRQGFPRISIEGADNPMVREHIREHDFIFNGTTGRVTSSVVIDPADGKIPYQPWAAAKRLEHFANSTNPTKREHVDGRALCYSPGVPRQIWSGVHHIIQTPGYVVMMIEEMHAHRIIPIDGRSHIGRDIKLHQGDSRGRWEGNTLVVDVTNQAATNWFDNAGDFYSDALHVVERWMIVGRDRIDYEVMLEDPKVYTRPWKMFFPLTRDKEGQQLMEYACHEGNRLPGLLRIGAK